MTEAADGSIQLLLPGEARFVRVARLVGTGLANELGLDVDALDDVRLAIGEACALAVQLGAPTLRLDFALDDTSLSVRVDATEADRTPHDDADRAEQIALTTQILTVACSTHAIEQDGRGWSFRMSFDARS